MTVDMKYFGAHKEMDCLLKLIILVYMLKANFLINANAIKTFFCSKKAMNVSKRKS